MKANFVFGNENVPHSYVVIQKYQLIL